ncbi:hypothetical protein FQR65_LT12067 [Abscondita terminalis]|nr:hypothetical protein FQR65_LT12067 [Abscondita terminalis]
MKSEHIMRNIKTIVKEATLAGFNVVATVCDQGSNNVKALKTLIGDTKQKYGKRGQSLEDNVFEVEIDENIWKRVIPLFDSPHLLKGIRNSLLQNDLEYICKGKKVVAKWCDIKHVWELDSHSSELRTLPRLTKFHVDKEHIKKMKVSVAAQTLSRSVAAVINLLATAEDHEDLETSLPKRATETAEFLLFFDKLFDSVNGTAGFDKVGKPLRTSTKLNAESSVQESFWREALPILNTLKVSGLKRTRDRRKQEVMPSFKNWIITIRNFLLLAKELRGLGYASFKPRSFQQDALENFFGRIRAKGFRNTNPTASSFTALYKTVLVKNLVSKHSLGSNCEDDGGNILFTMEHFLKDKTTIENTKEVEKLNKFRVDIPQKMEKQALGYVGGYLLKMRRKLIKCQDCEFNVFQREGENNDSNNFIQCKEYDTKRRLNYCNKVFLHNLSETYCAIKYIIRKYGHKQDLSDIVKTYIETHVKFNFIKCSHASTLESSIKGHFLKLILNNHCNGVNRIISGRDDRAVPPTASEIFLEAKNIFFKRTGKFK